MAGPGRHAARAVGARLGARARGRGGRHPGARLLRAGPALRLRPVRDGRAGAAPGARHPPRRGDPGRRAGRGGARAADASRHRGRPRRDDPRATSSGSRRCTTSSACRRATTSSPTSSGSCATRAGTRSARRGSVNVRGGIVDGPPLRQVCRLRRRPASRRRVDAPPVEGLGVRRSVRDDHTIGAAPARRTCHLSRTGMDGCHAGRSAASDRNAMRRRLRPRRAGRDAGRAVRWAPQTQC